MCRWMGLPFHEWIDYNGVAFSIELLEWGRIFSGFWGTNILASRYKMEVKYVFYIHFNKCVISF